MSSILKALKRLEQEKSTRKPEFVKIDAEILKSVSSGKRSSAALVIAACAVFASGGGAAYLFLKHDAPPIAAAKPQSPVPTAGTALSGIPTPAPVPETVSNANRNTTPAATTLNTATERPAPAPQPVMPRQKPRIELTSDLVPPTAPVPEQKSTAAPVAPPAKQSVLKLDGIAFQDGGADSLAVINGTTVSKGSLIEGARVEEIQKDRVRFSRGSEKFEVILDRSN